ncbi:MAG: cyclic nucleotide-binding domain-containing protein [Myxococcota bacterium]|jgi:CRP-like cAMP-binding protein
MITREDIELHNLEWIFTTGFFPCLGEKQQDAVLAAMDRIEYAPGERLITLNSPPRGIDLIVSGEVVVKIPSTGGGMQSIVRLKPGHMIGERSIFLNTRTRAEVRALANTVTFHLSTVRFQHFLDEYEPLRRHIESLVLIRDRLDELTGMLSSSPFFHGLGPDDIHCLLQSSKVMPVARGDVIIRVGENQKDVYFVVRGKVAVYEAGDRAGAGSPIAMGGPGYVFGELAAVLNRARAADVVAIDDGELLVFQGEVFRALVAGNPRISEVFYQRFARYVNIKADDSAGSAAFTVFSSTGPDLGLTTLGYGTAAAISQHSNRPTVIIDCGGAANFKKLGLG